MLLYCAAFLQEFLTRGELNPPFLQRLLLHTLQCHIPPTPPALHTVSAQHHNHNLLGQEVGFLAELLRLLNHLEEFNAEQMNTHPPSRENKLPLGAQGTSDWEQNKNSRTGERLVSSPVPPASLCCWGQRQRHLWETEEISPHFFTNWNAAGRKG